MLSKLSALLPRRPSPRSHLLILGAPSAPIRWIIHLASPDSILIFQARLSEKPDALDDLIPTGVIRSYSLDRGSGEGVPGGATLLPSFGKLKVLAAAELGEVPMHRKEALPALVARLLVVALELATPPVSSIPAGVRQHKDELFLASVVSRVSEDRQTLDRGSGTCRAFLARVEEMRENARVGEKGWTRRGVRSASDGSEAEDPLLAKASEWGRAGRPVEQHESIPPPPQAKIKKLPPKWRLQSLPSSLSLKMVDRS